MARPDQAGSTSPKAESVEDLFEALESPLLSYARWLLPDADTAEDVVQEAFMRLHTHFAEVREPRSWLYRTVHNLALNHQRKNAKIVNVLQDSTQIEFSSTPLYRVVKFIKDRHGIPIELDWREIDNGGVGTDARCTLNVRGVKLASALDKLVGDLGLTYVVEGEYILITVAKKAAPAEDKGKAKASAERGPRR